MLIVDINVWIDFLREEKTKVIETYIRALEIFRNCRKQVNTVRKTLDCIIASITIENKATIIHKDMDFEKIKESWELKTLCIG